MKSGKETIIIKNGAQVVHNKFRKFRLRGPFKPSLSSQPQKTLFKNIELIQQQNINHAGPMAKIGECPSLQQSPRHNQHQRGSHGQVFK